jgi:hypothetical protein
VALNQGHPGPPPGRASGGHQPGGPAAAPHPLVAARGPGIDPIRVCTWAISSAFCPSSDNGHVVHATSLGRDT